MQWERGRGWRHGIGMCNREVEHGRMESECGMCAGDVRDGHEMWMWDRDWHLGW